jgi:anti-sigma regulatory factor (Ser/Thr protein kinase)
MPTLDSMRGELAYSSRIAAALLAVLAESGDLAARTRALRALGAQGAVVQGRGQWIGAAELTAMFETAAVDGRLARRIGRALVRPDAVGLALCYGGLATTEKAYRRVHHLLARECPDARYEPRQIDGERGRIRFHLPETGPAERLDDDTGVLLCKVRQGMLEAIPLLFGLVPATVREKRCQYTGGPHCEFEVRWSRGPRTGLAIGAAAGTVLGAGVLLGSGAFGWPLWATTVAGPAFAIVCAAAGRSIDLARQLEAVAGARRGHLALLDQLDGALAERMDQLAKTGAIPPTHVAAPPLADAEPTGLVPVDRRDRAGAGPTRVGDTTRDAASHDGDTRAPDTDAEASGADDAEPVGVHDLREIVERVAIEVQGVGDDAVPIDLDVADDAAGVTCRPLQIACVVEQLLHNAVRATEEAAEPGARGRVRVTLRPTPDGVEVSVEDAGGGIDPELVERLFDPFAGEGPAGLDGGLGLPVCLRIVQGHHGEMRVQAREAGGTRVSFVLPGAPPA